MSSVRLTCVTATFNVLSAGSRETLERCIRSVAALKTDHEHILVDGASTDGTVEFLRELQEEIEGGRAEGGERRSEGGERRAEGGERRAEGGERRAEGERIRIISEKDTGIYNALNKGVKRARGEWFYVLGADDYICNPEVMDELLRGEERRAEGEERRAEVSAIVAPVVYDGDPNYSFHKIADLKNLFFWGYGYCHQGLLLKTDVIRRFGGFDERYRYCADGDLMMKVHKAGLPFRYTYEPYANFAAGGSNEQNRAKVAEETFDFLQRNLGLSADEKEMLRKEMPPVRLALKYWFSKDIAFRTSARHVFRARWGAFKHWVRNQIFKKDTA